MFSSQDHRTRLDPSRHRMQPVFVLLGFDLCKLMEIKWSVCLGKYMRHRWRKPRSWSWWLKYWDYIKCLSKNLVPVKSFPHIVLDVPKPTSRSLITCFCYLLAFVLFRASMKVTDCSCSCHLALAQDDNRTVHLLWARHVCLSPFFPTPILLAS